MNLKSRVGSKEKSTTKDASRATKANPLAKLAEYLKKMNSERRKTLQKLDEGSTESENEEINLPDAVVENIVNPEREAEMFTTFQKHQLDWDDIEARITIICRELMDGIKLLATNVNV